MGVLLLVILRAFLYWRGRAKAVSQNRVRFAEIKVTPTAGEINSELREVHRVRARPKKETLGRH
jgi:hypothetical protein